MKIVFTEQDRIDAFDKEVTEVLNVLGHPEAWVSDRSQVRDFFYHGDKSGRNETVIEELQTLCCDIVTPDSYIHDVAKLLCTRRKNQC